MCFRCMVIDKCRQAVSHSLTAINNLVPGQTFIDDKGKCRYIIELFDAQHGSQQIRFTRLLPLDMVRIMVTLPKCVDIGYRVKFFET
ncbi:Uncharacterised protein [Klebsiella pneumoniae]|nr:Uncharacterised protein [Klebsiella pneumoniae]